MNPFELVTNYNKNIQNFVQYSFIHKFEYNTIYLKYIQKEAL